MKLFESKKQSLPYTVIAGNAGFASVLARLLSAQGGSVMIIASNREDFLSISLSLDVHIIAGDVTDPNVLEEATIEKADTVVAATDDDNINLLAAQLAREVFGVKRVIALLNDPERECVYQAFDIPVFNPVLISAKAILIELSEEKKAENL